MKPQVRIKDWPKAVAFLSLGALVTAATYMAAAAIWRMAK